MGRKQRHLYKSVRADCNIPPDLTPPAATAQHAASIKNLSECFQETGAEEMGDKTRLDISAITTATCRGVRLVSVNRFKWEPFCHPSIRRRIHPGPSGGLDGAVRMKSEFGT